MKMFGLSLSVKIGGFLVKPESERNLKRKGLDVKNIGKIQFEGETNWKLEKVVT